MSQSESGILARIIRWFSGEDCDDIPKRKRGSVTEALARVAQAEERLTTVEEATMSMTVASLPEAARAKYEADNEEEDWF